MVDSLQVWDELEDEDAAYGLAFGFAKNFLNKQFMQGLSNMMDAWVNPERGGKKMAMQLATGFMPFSSLLRQVGTAMDPTLRMPNNMGEAFKLVIPKMREEVPPLYDIWGKAVKFEGTAAEKLLSPLRRSTRATDKATQEVDRLGVKPGSIRRNIGNIELSSPIYDMAQQLRGEYAKQFIDGVVNRPSWDKMPETIQADLLQKMFQKAGTLTRKKLLVTASNRAVKNIVQAIHIAQDKGDTASEAALKDRLQVILDREIIKLRRPIK